MSIPIRAQHLSPEGVAQLKTQLNVAALDDPARAYFVAQAQEFYASLDYDLPWVQHARPSTWARWIIETLQSAESKGLNPADYDGSHWNDLLSSLTASNSPSELDLIRFDVTLTLAAMQFVSDLHIGRANPQAVHFTLELDDKTLDLADFLREEIVSGNDPVAAVESVEPQFLAYQRTLQALNTYLSLAREDNGELLPVSSPPVRTGKSYAGAHRLRTLLYRLGDFNGSPVESRGTYDAELAQAVKHFQQRHGLEGDGHLNPVTLRQLNTPLSRRVVQLKLALERWRWLPSTFSRPPIVVNIPEFRLHVVNEQHRILTSMNVVVGRAYHHETPVFESAIESVIFRPSWTVPLEIQRNELLPVIEKDPLYLTANSYEVLDRNGAIADSEPLTEETKDGLRTGRLFLRQKPGSENSLGLIKFELPNPYDVYLHDTPARELFSKSRRDFSHGCIRVEDPVALAAWVLRDNLDWNAERIRATMLGDETLRVALAKPTPVWILYGTAVVLEDGQVRFFEDVYGHDHLLEQTLAQNDTLLSK